MSSTAQGAPRISLIVARADNGVIGLGGALPWRLRSDLKRFRALTMGKPLVMGRKTFDSLGKPLDGRDNIVITRSLGVATPGAIIVRSTDEALAQAAKCAAARGVDEIMIIGGRQIYEETLPLADRIYLTEVHAEPEGDTYFPSIALSEWHECAREPHEPAAGDQYACTFVQLDRAR